LQRNIAHPPQMMAAMPQFRARSAPDEARTCRSRASRVYSCTLWPNSLEKQAQALTELAVANGSRCDRMTGSGHRGE
jgi:hypothetical protein